MTTFTAMRIIDIQSKLELNIRVGSSRIASLNGREYLEFIG